MREIDAAVAGRPVRLPEFYGTLERVVVEAGIFDAGRGFGHAKKAAELRSEQLEVRALGPSRSRPVRDEFVD